MGGALRYQLRIDVPERIGEKLRAAVEDPELTALGAILARHHAEAVCQLDAFAGYCAEAERQGIDRYPLYHWTRATIDNPAKKARYLKSFTLYVQGEETYPEAVADALERELSPLVGRGVVDRLHRYDTDPANNPQPPKG